MTLAATRVVVAGGDTMDILPEGTRIRSIQHPELTGVIKHYEYNRPGLLSPIPYCIGWDDSAHAAALLGWLFVYPSPSAIEPLKEQP